MYEPMKMVTVSDNNLDIKPILIKATFTDGSVLNGSLLWGPSTTCSLLADFNAK
jgi:hypothetical protein